MLNKIYMSTPFYCDPSTALLLLEKEGFLQDELPLDSPLRRLDFHLKKKVKLPIIYDTREFDRLDIASNNTPSCVFVARYGKQFDAHAAIETIIQVGCIFIGEKKKASAYLKKLGRPPSWIKEVLSHPFFVSVSNSNKTLWKLLDTSAEVNPDEFTSLAVTGTNGKTSLVDITSQLLKILSKQKSLNIGTLGVKLGDQISPNSHPTMADYPGFLSFVRQAKEAHISNVIFEATSQGLDQERLGNWLVDAAFFSNLTPDHLDYHKDMESYFQAKCILFKKHLKKRSIVVVNSDDKKALDVCKTAALSTRRLILVGMSQPAYLEKLEKFYSEVKFFKISDIHMTAQELSGKWEVFRLGEPEEKVKMFRTPLIGKFQSYNLSMAAACMYMLGYNLKNIINASAKLNGIPGRFEKVSILSAKKLPTVVVDYAHSPDALEQTLKNCKEATEAKLICVFGCGGDRDKTKRPVMGKISQKYADVTLITSDNPRTEEPLQIIREIQAGMIESAGVKVQPDREKAIFEAIQMASPDDLVVIAGKGHEMTQEIAGKKTPFSDRDVAKKALEGLC